MTSEPVLTLESGYGFIELFTFPELNWTPATKTLPRGPAMHVVNETYSLDEVRSYPDSLDMASLPWSILDRDLTLKSFDHDKSRSKK